ncbi:MAG TPA: DegV family protein [Candidatus Limnocylindrales bacterium]|nr:DegV family protein [Candidatus Limnocylindrales bacterium]
MARVAIITDSASDLTPELASSAGIAVVPLIVTFGGEEFKAGVDLSTDQFWERMLAPDAPFPTTAAAAPGAFKETYEAAFAGGAEAIVSVHVAATLSGTMDAARIGASMLEGREIHLVDSGSASMAVGLLAMLGAELATAGVSAPEIARVLEARKADVDLYAALDTLEYLKRGGRISGPRAAVGSLLSIKPIITVIHGKVDTADRVRTRGKARERVTELLTQRKVERLAILFTPPADPEAFRDEVIARLPGGIDPARVFVYAVGSSVGPHLGPGCLGGVFLAASGD